MTLATRIVLTALIGMAGSAALLAAATPANGRSQAALQPVLTVLDMSPLVVRGTRFKSRERVGVVAAVPGPNLQLFVRASSTGRFTLNFRRTIACSTGFVVFAFGRGVGSPYSVTRTMRVVPPGTAPSCA